jgi:ADP-ribosyl-[dinitrogen reductase] hydrolase
MPRHQLRIDQVVGCVLGGAVGDALGAPFEGLWFRSIPTSEDLLAGFAEFEGYPRGQYTDDTQLTIATLGSIVEHRQIDPAEIARSIAKLWRTQEVVGPGGACTSAADRFLAGTSWRDCGEEVGQAGNGTAMRTAALGLYFWNASEELPGTVADISRITHKDPRSVAGGVAIAAAARELAVDSTIDARSLCARVAATINPFHGDFAGLISGLSAILDSDPRALREYIAWSGSSSRDFPEPIITPYVIPTVLASLWAVCAFPNSWPDATTAAIGLGGDVDTLGAIVGGLMGAKLGVEAIPRHLVRGVLHEERLRILAAQYAQAIASSG